MLSEPLIIQEIMNKINILSPKSRLYLIRLTCESLAGEQDLQEINRPLQFGEFAGKTFSTRTCCKIQTLRQLHAKAPMIRLRQLRQFSEWQNLRE